MYTKKKKYSCFFVLFVEKWLSRFPVCKVHAYVQQHYSSFYGGIELDITEAVICQEVTDGIGQQHVTVDVILSGDFLQGVAVLT